MSKLFCTVLTLLLTATTVMAGPVTKEQAQKKAAAFALKDGRSLSLAKNSVHKAPQSNGQGTSPYYVFDMTDNAGFVIISGDDRTREVIGYTESGNYDEENLPDNMKSWLQMIADRITTLGDDYTGSTEAPVPVVNDGVPMADVIIGPLMSSTWNQGSPYWNQCPFRNGSRCYTGCTATAFAQVMYYHRYPTGATTGIPGYTDDGLWIEELGSTTFNWNAMYNSYGANDNANEEVAKLMRYVGQGALMHYTEGGSGAAFVNAINALKNYFGYPSDIYEIHKDNYSSQDWMNALYSELYYGRPVLIEGYSDNNYNGGHAFVCDGYRNDGCFHINWGWGGWCDGYFSLDVLNPDDSSGMGAAQGSSGYYWHEGAVMNVRNPNGEGGGGGGYTTTDRPIATFYQDANYGGYGYSLPEGSFTLSQLQAYGIQNDDISSLKVLPGYKVTLYADDNFSGASAVYTGEVGYVGGDWNDQASSLRIEPNGVSGKAGTYKIKNRNSGKYLDLDGNSVEDNTAIVQWDDEGAEAYQQWNLIEVETGIYAIQAAASGGKGLDVKGGSVDNATQVLLYSYWGGDNQKFILVDKGDGYYQFVARYCGKVVEIPSSSTNSGEWIKIWENNGSYTQQWGLETFTVNVPSAPDPDKDASKVKSIFSGKYSSVTPGLMTGDWGQATQSSIEYPGDNEAIVWKNFNYLGLQFSSSDGTIDVSDMEYLHIDFYPLTDMDINIYPIALNPTDDSKKSTQHLNALQWNQVNIKLSDLGSLNLSSIGQLKFDNGNGQTIYVDNIYFWTSKEDEPVVVPAAPTPTKDASKVKAIYSNKYSDNNGGHYVEWWDGQAKYAEEELASGDNAWHISNFVFIGIEHNTIDVSNMEKLHLDVYPVNVNAGLSVFVIADGQEGYINVNATKGQWNQIDLSVADFKAKGIDMSKAYQIKITASDGANGQGTANFYIDNIYYWTDADNGNDQGGDDQGSDDIPAAPTPTKDASKVKSIFSGAYSSITPNMFVGSWGQATSASNVYCGGDEAYQWTNFNYLGLQFTGDDSTVGVSDMETLHVDIYPLSSMSIGICPIALNPTDDSHTVTKQLTANQWNSFDIPLSDFGSLDFSKLGQFKFDGGNGQTLYVDNIYFWTSGDGGQGGGEGGNDGDIPAAPTPTQDASKVKSIYSGQYTSPTLSVPEWAWQWLKTSDGGLTKETLDGDEALHLKTFNFASYEWSNAINASDMEYIHIDVYPVNANDITVHINGDESVFVGKSLTAGQWNSFDIPLSDFSGQSLSSVGSIKLTGANGADADGTKDLYVDNIYFWTSGDGGQGGGGDQGGDDEPVEITPAPTPDKDQSSVRSLMSDKYSNNGAFYAQWWEGQAKFEDKELASGDNAWHISNFIFLGIEHNTIDVSNMQYLHIDIFPVGNDQTISVFPVVSGQDNTDRYKEITVTANQWNSIDIPVSEFASMGLDMTQIAQLKLTGANGANASGTPEFYMDNVYYWTSVASGIFGIDAEGNAIKSNIYSIDGTLVKQDATNAKGLKKGIYIVNGKKIVIR